MTKNIQIAGLTVKPGEKKRGYLKIAVMAASEVHAPLTVINGVKDGPILSVLAGEHGCEYCGIEAAIRLSKDIKPKNIAGTLIVMPLVNVPAFEDRTLFVNPVDGVNVYTLYPGSLDASISYAMAYNVFNEVVLRSNYAVHLHGGDANEALVPFTYFAITGNKKVDEASESMARSFPVDYVHPMTELGEIEGRKVAPKGTSYTTTAAGTLYCEASKSGISATMVEAGRDGKIEEEFVSIHYNGVLNAMRYLGILQGKPSINNKAKKLKNVVLVSATKGGIFKAAVEIGDFLKKGQVIGEIRDLYGNTVETLISPINGLLVCKVNYAAADPYPTSRQPYLYYITEVE